IRLGIGSGGQKTPRNLQTNPETSVRGISILRLGGRSLKGTPPTKEGARKVLLAMCLIGIGLLVGCGGGPIGPKAISGPPSTEVTPAPAPTPGPCRLAAEVHGLTS